MHFLHVVRSVGPRGTHPHPHTNTCAATRSVSVTALSHCAHVRAYVISRRSLEWRPVVPVMWTNRHMRCVWVGV